MPTKYLFASDPKVYFGNGIALAYEEAPTIMSTRTFVNQLMDRVFVTKNPILTHKCTSTCGKIVQVKMGGRRKILADVIPEDLKELVHDFEDLLNVFIDEEYRYRVRSFGIHFAPCAFALEIIETVIHLC